MTEFWARIIEPAGQLGPDYWNYFARRLVELADLHEGTALLDIGTDDGNVLFKAMDKVGPHGRGVGIDIDIRGLQEGLPELRKRGLGNIAFAQMNADSLGFPAETFDCVLANFVGWDHCFDFKRMKFTTPDRITAEIMRVLKPGGQVGLGFWIEQCDLDWIAEAFARRLPEYFESVGEDFSAYGKENNEGYQTILRSCGFEKIRVHTETTSCVNHDKQDWWRQMTIAASDYFKQVTDLAVLERFKEEVFAELPQFLSTEGIQFSKTVAYIFGVKP